jgi:hypothetical protein
MGNVQARAKKQWDEKKKSPLFRRLRPKQRKLAKKLVYAIIALGFATAVVGVMYIAYLEICYKNNVKDMVNVIQHAVTHRHSDFAQSDKQLYEKAQNTPGKVNDDEWKTLNTEYKRIIESYYTILLKEFKIKMFSENVIAVIYTEATNGIEVIKAIGEHVQNIGRLFDDHSLKEEYIHNDDFMYLKWWVKLSQLKNSEDKIQAICKVYDCLLVQKSL